MAFSTNKHKAKNPKIGRTDRLKHVRIESTKRDGGDRRIVAPTESEEDVEGRDKSKEVGGEHAEYRAKSSAAIDPAKSSEIASVGAELMAVGHAEYEVKSLGAIEHAESSEIVGGGAE